MAQKITIDIVAETQKLTQGVNEVNTQLGSIDGKLKGVAAGAAAAASAFVLKQGVSFLKDGIEEAQSAELAMKGAEAAFGAGSVALQKITADATKFGQALGKDNDDLIVLATQLGTFLPDAAKGLSVELLNVGADVAALTGVDIEAWTKKLAKGLADGELKVGDLQKSFPGLTEATYLAAEAAFVAGDANKALSILISAANKEYGTAAEDQVTATQKFDVALANLKETVGTKILPFVNKLITAVTKLLDIFSSQPAIVQNVTLALLGLVAIGGPLLGFLASAKLSLTTLGIIQTGTTATTTAATLATNLFSLALKAIPILAIIALIVLLVQNWDKVKEVVDKVWNAIKDFSKNAYQALQNFFGKIPEFVSSLVGAFGKIPSAMLSIGRGIVTGLWDGIQAMSSWLLSRLGSFFGNLLPGWVKKILGISSPSKVFAQFGEQIVEGLAGGINAAKSIAERATLDLGQSTIRGIGLSGLSNNRSFGSAINITINAGLGTDPYLLGKEVNNAIRKYGKINSTAGRF
jgi:hypothetical protein